MGLRFSLDSISDPYFQDILVRNAFENKLFVVNKHPDSESKISWDGEKSSQKKEFISTKDLIYFFTTLEHPFFKCILRFTEIIDVVVK